MKGKIITGVVVVVILGLFWFFTTPLRANLTREKDVLNFVNLKGFNNISKESKEELKTLLKVAEDKESYDITDIVTDYIIKCEGAVPYKEQKQNVYIKETVYSANTDLEISKTGLHENCSWLLNYITDYHVKHQNTFTADLVANLEEKLEHRSPQSSQGWFINTQIASASAIMRNNYRKEYTIALPFGCYLEYKASKVSLIGRQYVGVKDWTSVRPGVYQVTLVDSNNIGYPCEIQFNNKSFLHKNDMTINVYGIVVNYDQAIANLYSPDQNELEESLDRVKR